MTFDPMRSIPSLVPSPAERPQSRTPGGGKTSAFEQTLERLVAAEAAGENVQGKMLAEMMRLQLMRSTVFLDFEDGPDADRLIPSLLPNFSATGRNPVPPSAGGGEKGETPSLPPAELATDDIVTRAARRYQLSPELVNAVIRAESSYNPRAVSPAGAKGLMQLMPGTARDMGVSDPFDPEQNVMGGTRYLRMMLDRYDGNVEKALAAYNWGPGNLDRSVGSLPRETREYIARINGYLAEKT